MSTFYDGYNEPLSKVIFSMYKSLKTKPDTLIIISGYVGLSPIKTLYKQMKKYGFQAKIIAGMYYGDGIDKSVYNSIIPFTKQGGGPIQLKFSKAPIHSKIYIWKRNNKILNVLLGSANFTRLGLYSQGRETLTAVSPNDYTELQNYANIAFSVNNSVNVVKMHVSNNKNNVLKLPLYSIKHGKKKILSKSGLNWGFSTGHTKFGDAYIPLPSKIVNSHQNIINPLPNSVKKNNKSQRNRLSTPIDVIWDDGTIMPMSFEGRSTSTSIYPKQLSSFDSKRILGFYLRRRLNIKGHRRIHYKDLQNYGRDYISLKLLQPGIYYADFK